MLYVRFFCNGKEVRKETVSARIDVLADVVLSGRPLARYETITAEDLRLEPMNLASLPATVILDPADAIGKRTRRKLPTGMPLRTDLIEIPPLVKQGDIVMIVAESAGLKITTLGKVKGQAGQGEKVVVENLDSRKQIHVTVMDAKTVRVDL
jgi:flagella basal body P-ring formation protein FlgA